MGLYYVNDIESLLPRLGSYAGVARAAFDGEAWRVTEEDSLEPFLTGALTWSVYTADLCGTPFASAQDVHFVIVGPQQCSFTLLSENDYSGYRSLTCATKHV